jgi:hypothetical protein
MLQPGAGSLRVHRGIAPANSLFSYRDVKGSYYPIRLRLSKDLDNRAAAKYYVLPIQIYFSHNCIRETQQIGEKKSAGDLNEN